MNAKSRALAALLPLWLVVVVAGHACAAEAIIGKVVGVSGGDTITVLEKPPHLDSRAGTATQHRIRLFGIDAPENHQAFGSKAKQFASELVFGRQVRVVKQDIDRYGRVVGIVAIAAIKNQKYFINRPVKIMTVRAEYPPGTLCLPGCARERSRMCLYRKLP
jgi:endonuclease YncB( thermonuclease family)